MTTAAVIAEYNPLHAGHRFHLSETRRVTGADCVLVILSGDFVQRGEPAVFDKFTRAAMALEAGADMVVELPLPAACGSAEYFAEGGVRLAEALGADFLSFGSETDDLAALSSAAEILADEPKTYRGVLRASLKRGVSFAAARELAVSSVMEMDSLHEILSSPNSLLAMEYLKAIRRLGSSLQPVAIRRRGAAYHDKKTAEGAYPSASSIREILRAGRPLPVSAGVPALPEAAFPLFADDLSFSLQECLLRPAGDVWDMPDSLKKRLSDRREPFRTWTELCADLKTRDLAYTRVSRALLHLLLGLTSSDAEAFRRPEALYGRILGLRKDSPLPALVKEKSRIPLITKLSDGEAALAGTPAGAYLEKDLAAHERYRLLVWQKYGVTMPEEHVRGIVTAS